jgi:DNA (cytosine-5)-methyltransferase 1
MGTLTGRDRHALVEGLDDIDIDDCFFRMLLAPEIGRGMAFDDSYTVTGNQREKVKQYGQAVTPPVPAALWQRIVESLA